MHQIFNTSKLASMISMLMATGDVAMPRAYRHPPFGSSSNTTAADKRRAKKRKAIIRARKSGHA